MSESMKEVNLVRNSHSRIGESLHFGWARSHTEAVISRVVSDGPMAGDESGGQEGGTRSCWNKPGPEINVWNCTSMEK